MSHNGARKSNIEQFMYLKCGCFINCFALIVVTNHLCWLRWQNFTNLCTGCKQSYISVLHLRVLSHQLSASLLTLKKNIIDFQLLCSDVVMLVIMLENGSQTHSKRQCWWWRFVSPQLFNRVRNFGFPPNSETGKSLKCFIIDYGDIYESVLGDSITKTEWTTFPITTCYDGI